MKYIGLNLLGVLCIFFGMWAEHKHLEVEGMLAPPKVTVEKFSPDKPDAFNPDDRFRMVSINTYWNDKMPDHKIIEFENSNMRSYRIYYNCNNGEAWLMKPEELNK